MKNRLLLTLICIIGLFSTTTFAQTISGKITDTEGSPLIGASVLVKGSSNGTVTDNNGAFTLNNVTKGSTLVVSFVGYTSKELSADANLNISLEEGDALGELIVTAENRSVSAQSVPITLELVTGKAIQQQGVTDLLQLQNLAPGLNIVQNTIFNQVNIRGIGSNDGAAEMSDQAVTVGIDGEYLNRPVALNASMFDLDRVEVLKGPQGTLYGRNATAGAVNIIAKKPNTTKTEVDVNATYGNYNTIKLNGAVNLPLGNIAAIRVAGMLSKHDGYRESSGTGAYVGRFDNGNVWAARAGLTVNPTKAFSIYVVGEINKTDQQAPSQYGVDVSRADSTLKGQAPSKFTYPLPKDFPVATPGFMKVDQGAFRGRIAYDFGAAKITYTGGYRDVALTGYQPLNGFIPETFSFHNALGYKTQSHELRVNGESEKLIWQAGLFYGYETQAVRRGLILPVAKGAFGGQVPFLNFFWRDMESTTTGVFAQATYNITEKLSLTGGLRNTGDKKRRSGADLASAPFGPPSIIRFFYPDVPKSATQAGMKAIVDSTSTWNKLTYLVDLDYKPNANQLIFVKYSTGYKAGGFDNLGAYKPEYLKSFEIGSKNKFADNKLRLNASYFHYNYEDQQVTVFISTAIGGAIKNAGSTSVNGLEIDGEFLATKADRFKFTVNYLDAKFNDFLADRNRVGAEAENSINLKGNRPVQSPKWTLVGGYNHDFAIGEGKLNVGIQTLFKSEYFISPFNFTMDKQEAYTKTDVFATYTAKGGRWDIGAFVQNLEDNRILSYAGFTGNTINIYNWIFGSPRLFGIQAGYHF